MVTGEPGSNEATIRPEGRLELDNLDAVARQLERIARDFDAEASIAVDLSELDGIDGPVPCCWRPAAPISNGCPADGFANER